MSEPAPLVGQRITHYRILEQIGKGGMGVVYQALDERLGRDVALKVLSPELAGDQEFAARFRREARTLSKLNHPNIATVHDFDSQSGVTFIVMELVQGASLLDKVRGGALPESETIRLALDLLDGLSAAHSQGIIHRDLKPSNLRETLDGRLKILDFGLAYSLGADPNATQSIASTGVIGTLPYMAPEQLRGEPADARTDIYASGAVLYELATGSRPFPDNFAPRLTDSILHRVPVSTRELNPKISVSLDSVIRAALEKEPAHRFTSAREMREAIDRIRIGAVDEDVRASIPKRSRELPQRPSVAPLPTVPQTGFSSSRRLLAAATIVVLCVIAAGSYWLFRGRPVLRKTFRPTVAILGFKNLSAAPESDWISTSMGDMLSSELSAGEKIVATPAETVSRMKIDLALPNEATYAEDTVQRIHGVLRCDYIVSGSFFDAGKSNGGRVDLIAELRNAKTGEEMASVRESGIETALPELAARVGTSLRSKLRLPAVSVSQAAALQAAVPSTPEASRLYFQGLGQLRHFDMLGAKDSLKKAIAADPNFSLAHAYLAQAWSGLGYDDQAKTEAKVAFDLSSHLSREDKTLVEARFRESSSDWDKAVDLYHSLATLYPENPEYALRAADAQIREGKPNEALATIAKLREESDSSDPNSIGADPRLALKEAEAAEALSDLTAEKRSAQRAAEEAGKRDSRLLQAEALWRSCAAMAFLGEIQNAQKACTESISISQPVGDLLLVARAYTILGMIASAQGDPRQSLADHRQALAFATKVGSRRDITGALTNIGNQLADQGDLDGAQRSFEAALAQAEEIKDRAQIVTLLNNLATISQTLGRFSAALGLYNQSLDEARVLQDKGSVARAQSNLAFIFSLKGNFSAALQNIQQAIRAAEETGNKSDQSQFRYSLGDIQLDQGDPTAAEQSYEAGLRLATTADDKSLIALGRLSLARLRLHGNKAAEAMVLARQASDEFKTENRKDLESSARNLIAAALLDLDRPADASAELDLISKLSSQDPTIKLAVSITSGRLKVHTGSAAAGKSELTKAAAEAAKLGLPGLQFEARLAQGEAAVLAGDKRSALSLLSVLQKDAARSGFRRIAVRAGEISDQVNASKATG